MLHDTKQLDFMVALGTHPPLNDESLHKLVGITTEERTTKFKLVGLLNHAWDMTCPLVSNPKPKLVQRIESQGQASE